MENKHYTHIIWDWNGTLLNDLSWSINSINRLLKSRNKKTLSSTLEYQNAFCFPIIEYYKNVGFNFDEQAFKALAHDFIALYHGEGSELLNLHTGVEEILKAISNQHRSQIILSASSRENLLQQVGMFAIDKYFDHILGISDIYAKSKVEIALDYISKSNAEKVLMIGDTIHDFEVAQALSADCLLIAKGHQSEKQLLSCGVPVLKDIRDVLKWL